MNEYKHLMDDDLWRKCDTGAIINSTTDWKQYAALSPDERSATQQRLRNDPRLTLKAALPQKEKKIAADDLEAINQCSELSPGVKRSIAAGTIAIDRTSIKKLLKLPPEQRIMIDAALADPAVESLRKAINAICGTAPKKTRSTVVMHTQASFNPLLDRMSGRLIDLEVYGVDTTSLKNLIDSLRSEINSIQ